MMKRLAFVVCLVLAISMSAFSFAEEAPSQPSVIETPAPEVTKAPEATKAPEVTKAPEATAAPTAEPVITIAPTETPAPVATETPAPVATETPAPVATETPAPVATETPAPVATETPAPVATETPAPVATEEPIARSISIKVNAPDTLHYGDKVTLTATLTGYEDASYTLQWQYSSDGSNWRNRTNANKLTCSFKVNERTANTMWRLIVTVID